MLAQLCGINLLFGVGACSAVAAEDLGREIDRLELRRVLADS